MDIKSYKVSDSLYLIQSVLDNKQPAKPVEVQTNHIAVIDCSGSMYSDIPKIREQLKKKLPKMLKEKDTISIIWFSGRGEFGALLEAEPVSTLADLKDVNNAIDRWIKCVGLTGFKEPLEEVERLVDRVSKKVKGGVFSLFFMSDGCDNQWPRADVIKAVEKASGKLASATFVEYGYYADRPLLTQMAEKAGGSLIFAEDFDKFAPSLEASLQKKLSGGKRIEVKVPGDTIGGFAYSFQNSELTVFGVENGQISVPDGTQEVWYLSPTLVGVARSNDPKDVHHAAAFAALSLYTQRMKSDVVLSLLRAIGDVHYIEKFGGLFGKQKYSEFMEESKEAVFDEKKRFQKGYDPTRIPKDDAFTVLDLLRILSDDDNNALLLDHPDFKYSRIGRGRVDASEVLTADELDEIQKLTAQIAAEKDPKKITDLNFKIAAITTQKGPGLKFVADPAPDGYGISNLTYNEDRPNVSVLVRKAGTVDLSPKLPDGLKGKLPEKFPTFIYRNYAIVKDGLVNVEKLPVKVSAESLKKLRDAGMPDEAIGGTQTELVFDLKKLPVINRKMVKSVSAKSFFETEYELVKAQAAQKIYNSYSKDLLPQKESKSFSTLYGDEAANWLKEQGFTDYSGFSPKSVQVEAKDFYMGKELKVSLKGLSKLPSLKELREMITKGKVNAPGLLMKPYMEEVDKFLTSDIYKKAADKNAVLEAWLNGQQKDAKSKTRKLIYDVAQTTFCLIVGQVWFSEFSSLDENTMKIKVDGQEIEAKAEMRDIEIKI